MSTRGEYSGTAAAEAGRPVRRTRATLVGGLTAALVAGLLALAVAPAAAAATDPVSSTSSATGADSTTGSGATSVQRVPAERTPAPSDDATAKQPGSGSPTPTTPPTTPPTQQPSVDPTIADPGDLTTATGRFQGTATPGHRVRVVDPGVPSASVCTAITASGGTWSCYGRVTTGPQQVFTVQDVTDPSRGTADAPAADVVVPPTITTNTPTTGSVGGTGDAGTTVTVALSGSSATRTALVGADGRWIVSWSTGAAPHPDGTVTMTATATASTADGYRSDLQSAASSPATVTFDRTAPAAPTITTPRSEQRVPAQSVAVSGTGEPKAQLTVYVDRAPVCGATVSADGSWTCTTTAPLPVGTNTITALQHDAAGNHSKSSAPVVVLVVAGTPGTATGTPGQPAPSGTGGSGTGVPGANGGTPGSGGPSDGAGSGGVGDGGSGSGTPGAGAGGSGSSGNGSGGHTGRPDWSGSAGDWSVATSFDRTVPTIQSAFSWNTLIVAAAVALGFLLLIAGPARLVARTLRGRVALRLGSFTGRNRPRAERRRGDDALPTWASVSIAVVLAAVLTLLGVGVSLEARYVRLAIAVLLGTAVLAAAVVLATRWAAGSGRHMIGFRVSPWLVVVAVAACALTRVADLSPALVIGVLLVPFGRTDLGTGPMRLGAGVAACARNATWRSGALLVLAVVGWVLHSLTTGSGFWTALVSEFAITLCVGGLGSLVATLLPLAGSAGSALWKHSRTRYASIAVVGVALAAAVYSGQAGTHVSPVALAVVGCASVAVAVGTWLWVRILDTDTSTTGA